MGTKLTTAGITLLSRAIAGETLTFTRGALGDAMINDNVVIPTDDEQAAFANLIHQRLTLPLVGVNVLQNGRAKIELAVSNADVEDGFRIREFGVFAKIGDETEQLYAYCYAGEEGDFMPQNNTAFAKAYILELIVVISNAANITAIINPNVEVTRADFDAHINSDNPHPNWQSGAIYSAGDNISLSGANNDVINTKKNVTFDQLTITNSLTASTIDALFVASKIQTAFATIYAYDNNINCWNSNISLEGASIYGSPQFDGLELDSLNAEGATISLNGASIAGSPSIYGSPHFEALQAASLTADSIDARHGKITAWNSTIDIRRSSMGAKAAEIRPTNGTIDLAGATLFGGGASMWLHDSDIEETTYLRGYWDYGGNQSTIRCGRTIFKGRNNFSDSNNDFTGASIAGSPSFTDGLDKLKINNSFTANSVTANFVGSNIRAYESTIDAELSNISLQSASIHGDVEFYGQPEFLDGYQAKSVHAHMIHSTIHAGDASISADDATISGDVTFKNTPVFSGGLSCSNKISLQGASITGSPTFTEGFSSKSTIALNGTSISLNVASIYGGMDFYGQPEFRNGYQAKSVQAHMNYATVQAGNASIYGTPNFPDGLVLGTASSTQDGAIWFVP